MHGTLTQAEWLKRISALTVDGVHGAAGAEPVTGPDDLTSAQSLAAALAAAAADYRAAFDCRHTAGGSCPLDGITGGRRACELAQSLGAASPSCTVNPERAAAAWLGTLRAAATAVYHCRRIAHPTGACWFADGHPGQDCGAVLAAAHQLG